MAEPTLELDTGPAPVVADPGGPADAPPPTPEFVFREYAPRIYAVARRLVGNDADASLVLAVQMLRLFSVVIVGAILGCKWSTNGQST